MSVPGQSVAINAPPFSPRHDEPCRGGDPVLADPPPDLAGLFLQAFIPGQRPRRIEALRDFSQQSLHLPGIPGIGRPLVEILDLDLAQLKGTDDPKQLSTRKRLENKELIEGLNHAMNREVSTFLRYILQAASITVIGFSSGSHAEVPTIPRSSLGMFQPLPEVAASPDNPLTQTKVDLGRMLYYDTRFSADRTVSCNTCHALDSFGDDDALSNTQKEGLHLFFTKGCITCHQGAGVGGHMYQKLGLVKPWPGLKDKGRGEVKGFEALEGFFKVPSLRNVTETAPYLHDGSVKTLEDAVRKMAEYQQGQVLTDEETEKLVAFLKSLKGEIPHDYIKKPELPADGPDTPKP